MSDGLEEITIRKDYGDSPAGATLRVDPGRAAWLRDHGYEAGREEPEAPRARRNRHRGSAPEPEASAALETGEEPVNG